METDHREEKQVTMEEQEAVKLKRIFPGRHFLCYHIPKEISTDIAENMEQNFQREGISEQHWKNRENVRHAVYDLAGSSIAIFPAIPEEQQGVPYWTEAFSVFFCNSQFFTRREQFASYMILYTYGGDGYLEYEGKTYHLKGGDGFFIDCERPHFYYAGKAGWQHSVLHLQGEKLSFLYQEFCRKGENRFSFGCNDHYQKNLQNLLEIYERPSPVRQWLAADRISRLLTDLLECSLDEGRVRPGIEMMIAKTVGFMEQNFTVSMSLDELSAHAGVSRYYFAHEFKRYMGISPMAYLAKLRIGHAKILLESTQLPVSKIAETVGALDINHFYRQFKKYTGSTPAEYRKCWQ